MEKKNKFSTVFYRRRRKKHLSPQKRNTLISLETKEKQPPDLESFSKDHSFTHSLTHSQVSQPNSQSIYPVFCTPLRQLFISFCLSRTHTDALPSPGWDRLTQISTPGIIHRLAKCQRLNSIKAWS